MQAPGSGGKSVSELGQTSSCLYEYHTSDVNARIPGEAETSLRWSFTYNAMAAEESLKWREQTH